MMHSTTGTYRRAAFAVLVAFGALSAPTALAADPPRPDAMPALDAPTPPAYLAKLDQLDAQLGGIEIRINAVIQEIEATKAAPDPRRHPPQAADQLDRDMMNYTRGMHDAAQEALAAAKDAVQSKGKRGNIRSIDEFERRAQTHEVRWNLIAARADGAVKQCPNCWRQGSVTFPKHAENTASEWSPLDVVVPPAHALAILPCVGQCTKSALLGGNWAPCAGCCINAGSAAIAAWNAFVQCWNSAPSKPNWLRVLRRTACVVAFVAKVA